MTIKHAIVMSFLAIQTTLCLAVGLADAPIQHVTLYPTSAKIERSIPVKAGQQIVTLEGLTANFDINQLQYQTSNIDVNAVSHTDSALNKPAGQESQQLILKIEETKAKISEHNAIIQAAELQNKFLGNITKGSPNKVRRQAYDAFVAIDQAKLEKTRLEQVLAELEQDLNSIGDHQFNQRSLKFYVNAQQSGEIKMSYIVPYARWQPIYKAELNTQTKQVKLTRMAMIAQKTGEDWNNVQLSLSTATPQNILEDIHPMPWWVNYNEPRTNNPMHAPVMQAPPLDYEAVAEKKSQSANRLAPPQFPQFQANALNFSTEFKADTQASIRSSRQQIYLPLSAEEYPAKLSVWVIPRKSNHAILNAEINTLVSNLPSGHVKLYRDGDYIGQRQWSNSAENNVQMSFGYDEQIQVKVTDLIDKKNTVRKTQSETRQKQIYSVQNRHNYPIEIKLFDAEPQSQNSKLTAKSTYSLAPSKNEWNGQPYLNQWEFQLAPKQKFELNIERDFHYPTQGNTSGF